MEKDLAEASSSVLADPGSSCNPEKVEGDCRSTSKQFPNVSDVSQKDELLSDQQHETETDDDQITTNMGKHDDKSEVTCTSVVKPQVKNPGAIPKKFPKQLPQSPESEESHVQQPPMTAETFSSVLTVSALEEDISSQKGLTLTNSKWPSWSLPPPERDKKHEDMSGISDQGIDKKSCTITSVEESAQSRTLTKKLASSLSPESNICKESETFNSKQNETLNVEIIKQTCVTGQDTTMQSSSSLSPHPITCNPEEGGNSSHNASSLVTGPQLLGTSATVVTCSGRSGENLNSQQSRNPAEHDDVLGNDGLLQQLKKENEMLLLNDSYLVQELRIQSEELRRKSVEVVYLKQQLEASKAENAELLAQRGILQQENGELRDHLNDREIVIAENLQTIQMAEQLLIWKTEECERLKERVPQPIPEEDD